MEPEPSKENIILYISFNPDSSCFVVGTETGFCVYNTLSLTESFSRDMKGGIGIVEMLNRSNILALVGGGKNPKYSNNKAIIWDDHQSKIISEIRFNSEILNLKLSKTRLFVLNTPFIYEFELMSFKLLETHSNYENPKGLFALWSDQSDSTKYLFASVDTNKLVLKQSDIPERKEIKHNGDIECLSLSQDGEYVVSSVIKGYYIYVYETKTCNCVKEFKRGNENTEICYFVFDAKKDFVACTNNKKTIHLYSLCSEGKYYFDKGNENEGKGGKGVFGMIGGFLWRDNKSVSSDKSIFKFTINDENAICCFKPENMVIVITGEGHYYKFKYEPKTGETNLIEEMDIDLVKE